MRKIKLLSKLEKEWTTMKRVVYICLANGILWIWCSYILSFMGREQIAENLSQVALTEIVAVVLVYALKSVVENLSKHNRWPDKGEKTVDDPIKEIKGFSADNEEAVG